MTAMTRTPVTVAEMVNGDLIAHGYWDDDMAVTFIGRIPSDRSFVTLLRNGNPAIRYDNGNWRRLTKPATLCKCGKEIEMDAENDIWLHSPSETRFCNLVATPAEVTA